ncbi:glycerophosphodiester phosphodiesterase [Psychroflexus tropicus]|uniref:glycerophosphodiester phosphodiesterase n=1 Tax=Psychroflexus tropicus TaxID=197345 RepID=UPI00036672BD|nr:glycerophosphodiester phosphodiesterase [Psychroflexus tropicus]
MKYAILLLFTIQVLNAQTLDETLTSKTKKYKFDLQGHRGARGLAPENTLKAFQKALELGVNTLELDLAVTKDQQLIVSHEPWMNADICLTPGGEDIKKAEEKSYNIYTMTYEEVRAYDCGSKYNPAFPEQDLEPSYKPLLKDVLHMADSLNKNHGKKIKYNIELKSLPEGDDLYHPIPAKFVKLVMDVLQKETDLDRVNLQSFDFRILKELHSSYPDVKLAALVYNSDFDTAMAELGFVPEIYSPYYPIVDQGLVSEAQAKGMKVIPWTINTVDQMKMLLKLGVDGLITDYPDRALKLRKTVN